MGPYAMEDLVYLKEHYQGIKLPPLGEDHADIFNGILVDESVVKAALSVNPRKEEDPALVQMSVETLNAAIATNEAKTKELDAAIGEVSKAKTEDTQSGLKKTQTHGRGCSQILQRLHARHA